MMPTCPASCGTCYLMDPKVDCSARKPGLPVTLAPGQLPQQFVEIVSKFPELEPKVLHSTDPHVLYLGKFLDDAEIAALLAGYKEAGHRFATSTELDAATPTTKRRTSESMPCNSARCWNDERVLAVHQRATEVLGMPLNHQEFIQIVKYEPGQQYRQHYDTSNTYHEWPQGHRVFTMFLYLSDVEAGGETIFPNLGISVKPRKGAALVWSNVEANNTAQLARDSVHAGGEVQAGTKLAANMWMYQHDYRTPWKCGWLRDVMHGRLGYNTPKSRYRL